MNLEIIATLQEQLNVLSLLEELTLAQKNAVKKLIENILDK